VPGTGLALIRSKSCWVISVGALPVNSSAVGGPKWLLNQDPGSLQELVQAPLMAVRLGSAHFNDVAKTEYEKAIVSIQQAVNKLSNRVPEWQNRWLVGMSHGNQSRRNYATMDAKLVSLSGRILLGSKKLHFGFFYKRLAYGILPTTRIWLGRKKLQQQSNSDDEEG